MLFRLDGAYPTCVPHPLPLKHFGPPVSFVKQSFEREREKDFGILTPSHMQRRPSPFLLWCWRLRHHHPVGARNFFFLPLFFVGKIFEFFFFFFKHSLKSFYALFLFLFFFFRKWALTCRLSSAVESFDKLFRLTFQMCQDFCNQPSFRWRHESTEIAKRARAGERESWKTT